MGEEKRDEEEGKKEGRERERKGNKVREELRERKKKKRAVRVFLSSSSSSLSVALLLLLSPNLHPLISSPSPSLPPSLVLPRRLFVCTSIIPGDKRRPFHRSHANLKPDTLSFLFSFQISPFFFSCETSGYNDR